jgi:nifB-related protein
VDSRDNCKSFECGTGACGGDRTGCSGPAEIADKVEAISDCRCVVCKKIGFQAQKQFEKKAISVFDVACTVQEALDKITFYYGKLDNHESFGIRKNS